MLHSLHHAIAEVFALRPGRSSARLASLRRAETRGQKKKPASRPARCVPALARSDHRCPDARQEVQQLTNTKIGIRDIPGDTENRSLNIAGTCNCSLESRWLLSSFFLCRPPAERMCSVYAHDEEAGALAYPWSEEGPGQLLSQVLRLRGAGTTSSSHFRRAEG